MRRHECEWEEVGRTFTPPVSNVGKFSGGSEEFAQQFVVGLTNIEMTCIHCGRIDVLTFPGKVNKDA
jgi:hypothetical protein